MIQCPICFNYVPELKPNCHIIPKWALDLTKEDGKNFVMSTIKTGPNQSDLKTQSWCADCEKGFAGLDGAAVVFFRDNPKLLSDGKSEMNKYVFHDVASYRNIRRFLTSVVARYYLYLLNERKTAIGESIYTDIYKAFLNDEDVYFVLRDMRKFLSTTSGCPVPSFGTIQLMINGILIVLTMDMIGREFFKLNPGEIVVHYITDPENPYVKQHIELQRKNYSPELYERFKEKFGGLNEKN